MTTLTFIGTKGYIEEESSKHQKYSSMIIGSRQTRFMIDYGVDKEEVPYGIKAILITHAHPDHYAWLKKEVKTKVTVYLTKESLSYAKYEPDNLKIIKEDEEFMINDFKIRAYNVIHSLKAPAIGYRVTTPNNKVLVYNPDLIKIKKEKEVLTGVDYYIGDGSSIKTNLVRHKGDKLYGHARIKTQINWCKKYNIPNIMFTHLGKESIRLENDFLAENPDIKFANDGMKLLIE